MQLNRFLAICGVASRRKATDAIVKGRVNVNNQPILDLGRTIDPDKDLVDLDGHRLAYPRHFHYILLNKPRGVITTVDDDRGRKTVLDLIDSKERLFPVGRLDFDTVGTLLLTNDGDLTYRLTHPKYRVEKIYHVWVKGRVGETEIQQLKRGVAIEPDVVVHGDARIISREPHRTRIKISIHEGKKRQIKRMMKAIGSPVIQLERHQFAGLTTGNLKRGEWRHLTEVEVNCLYEKTGLIRTLA